MKNLKEALLLQTEPTLPDNWCILEIHITESNMEVRFYKPYSSDDVIIAARTLDIAITKFFEWLKETDDLIEAMKSE